MFKVFINIFSTLCLFISTSAFSWQKTVEINSNTKKIPLALNSEYIEDKTGKLTLDDIKKEINWNLFKVETPSLGFTSSTYWLRFKLINQESNSKEFFLDTEYHGFDNVKFYLNRANGNQEYYHIGDSKPFYQRLIEHKNLAIPIIFEKNEIIEVYVSFSTSGPLFLPLVVINPHYFIYEQTTLDYFQGYWYGILIAILFYNLFLFFSVKDKGYIIYVGYIVSLFLFQASQHGYSFQYFWPNHTSWVNIAVATFLSASNFFVVLFAINFLKLSQYKKIYKLTKVFLFICFACFVCSFFVPYHIMIKISSLSSMIISPFLFIIGVFVLKKGYYPARFYLIAFGAFLIAMMIAGLKAFGLIPANIFTTFIVQIGSSIETILLSIALGDKIKIEDNNKTKQINNLNTTLEEKNKDLLKLNESLEEKVEEKTKEIGSLLHNINSGILSIGKDGIVSKEYSAYLPIILQESNIAEKNIDDLFFNKLTNGIDIIDQCRQSLNIIIGDDELNYSFNEEHLIKEAYYLGKILKLDWSIQTNEEGVVEKVLLVINDVTKQREQEVLVKQKDEHYLKLKQLINAKEDKSTIFFNSNTIILEKIESYLKNIEKEQTNHKYSLEKILECYHTIKGAARTLGLTFLTNTVHEKEQKIKHLTDQSLINDLLPEKELNNLFIDLVEVKTIYNEYLEIHTNDLNRSIDREKITLRRLLLETHYQTLVDAEKEISKETSSNLINIGKKLDSLIKSLNPFLKTSLADVFDAYKEDFSALAKELGKKSPSFNYDIRDSFLKNGVKETLDKVFVHIIRNTMDHGIETPEEREAKNKPSFGTIFLKAYMSEDNKIVIETKDDGRGLNINKLRSLGLKNGIIKPNDDEKTIAETIFSSGMSTAEKVSDISGRGVGMGAVRQFLRDAGGDIIINTGNAKDDGFFDFSMKIILPNK